MAYTPDGSTLTEPTSSRTVGSAASEFRALKAWSHSKTLRVPDDESVLELPNKLARALKLLYCNSNGDVVGVTPGAADVGNLSLNLLADGGSGLVTYKRSGPNTVALPLNNFLDQFALPQTYGATGNGVADDSDGLEDAILAGVPLDFGSGIYRITRELDLTLLEPLVWKSNGAVIIVDSATAIRTALRLNVGPYSHRISGNLTIDGNLDAFTGLYLENTTGSTFPGDYADFQADGLHVQNCYRSSITYNGGDGIHLRGPWRVIQLITPIVENIRMATGAGVPSSQGVAGITFSSNTQGPPLNVEVISPYIASILSEDGTYTSDQDGIRHIVDPSDLAPYEAGITVQGGTFRNCYGRSIKIQSEYGTVKGCKFIRTQGFTRGYGNEEVDFQEGGGSLTDCESIYNGSAPDQVVRFSSTRQGPNTYPGPIPPAQVLKVSVPYGRIDGLKIAIYGATTLHDVWTNSPVEGGSQIIAVSGVEVFGTGVLEDVATFNSANAGTGYYLLMDNVIANPQVGGVFVNCASTDGSVCEGKIKASRCINTSATARDFRRSTSGNFRPYTSVDQSIGFNEANDPANATTPMGTIRRMNAFAPEDVGVGGLNRAKNLSITNATSQTLPATTHASGSGLALISIQDDRDAQALVSFDSTNGVRVLAQGATKFVAGALADPGGANAYRMWFSSGGLTIYNNSGATKEFTCFYLG